MLLSHFAGIVNLDTGRRQDLANLGHLPQCENRRPSTLSQQGLDDTKKALCNMNSSFCVLLGHMGRDSIVPYIAQPEEPVQFLAVLLVQLAGLDQPLMCGSDDSAVLTQLQSFIQ